MKDTTKMLLEASSEIWEGYHVHPFVKGISDETLDIEKFKFYMIQDYLYLIDYAKVFAVGVAKAQDLETMRIFAGYLHQIFDGEMDIHRSYMQRLGISLEEAENTPASLDTASYTSYMLKVAYEYGEAEIAATILACAVSYEVIAKRILEDNPKAIENNFYGEWVEGYSAGGYAEANRELEKLMDRLALDYNEEESERLKEIFIKCSRYEKEFWDMAWEKRM